MKQFIPIVAALTLFGGSPAQTSRVTVLIHKTGCLALSPFSPTHFSLLRTGGATPATNWRTLLARVVRPPESITLQLRPGYYLMSIESPRCWKSWQNFVVGSEWNRNIAVEAGFTKPPPSKTRKPVLRVDYAASSGLVLHTGPNISKVRVKYDGGTKIVPRNGNVWYLDDAPVGPVKVRLYTGRRLVLTDFVVLQFDGFLERFYVQR